VIAGLHWLVFAVGKNTKISVAMVQKSKKTWDVYINPINNGNIYHINWLLPSWEANISPPEGTELKVGFSSEAVAILSCWQRTSLQVPK